MAKTARKRKSKQEQVSEELKLRIVCLFVIFLLIISAMQLGFIGEHLDYIFSYLFGNLNGIVPDVPPTPPLYPKPFLSTIKLPVALNPV